MTTTEDLAHLIGTELSRMTGYPLEECVERARQANKDRVKRIETTFGTLEVLPLSFMPANTALLLKSQPQRVLLHAVL